MNDAMNTSEWIEAASEVISDTTEPTVAAALNDLLRKYGAHAVVDAIRDAADAALDHLTEDGETDTRPLDEVRGHLRMACEWLEVRS